MNCKREEIKLKRELRDCELKEHFTIMIFKIDIVGDTELLKVGIIGWRGHDRREHLLLCALLCVNFVTKQAVATRGLLIRNSIATDEKRVWQYR